MTVRIVRASGLPLYFSSQVGADYGAPQGGWTPDREKAQTFPDHASARAFLTTRIAEAERVLCQLDPPQHHPAREETPTHEPTDRHRPETPQ